MNKKKMLLNAVLNIAAAGVPVVALQLIILPLLAQFLPTGDDYGMVVTLVALITVVSQTLGPLNNIRLLMNSEYSDRKLTGDFNLLLVAFTGVGTLATVIGTFFYADHLNGVDMLLLSAVSGLMIICGYLSVAFRIEINYRKILVSNIIQCMGYLVGFVVFVFSGYWQWIYLMGYFFQLIYILSYSALIHEPFVITPLMGKAISKSSVLLVASLLASTANYIDRFLLFPLIGGAALSVYYASTVLGKAMSLVISPISDVMLSYFAKMKSIKTNSVTMIIGTAGLAGAIGYFACIAISPTILRIIYPQWADEAIKLVNVTTLTAVMNVMCSVIGPIILKFRNVRWQIAINAVNITIYTCAALFALKLYGIMGFCVGALVATSVKMLLMIAICYCSKTKP